MAKRRSPTPSDPSTADAGSAKTIKVVSLSAVSASEPAVPSTLLRQKDFVAAVAARCEGVKKADLRQVLDAALAELAAAFGRGQSVNLAGFGKARVAKTVDRNGTPVMTLKFQPTTGKKSASSPLAQGED